jgi:T4 bacteriophage base plate protein
MKLSEIDTSVYYNVTVPSLKKEVKFRPFNVKQEKALLTAQESEDVPVMLSTLEEVVRDCIKDCPPNLTTFDIEYLFIKIRAKSVGEESTIIMKCKSCAKENKVTLDLNDVTISNSNFDRKLIINDKLAVVMKYPSIEDLNKLSTCDKKKQVETSIAISIETVYFGDTVFHTKDAEMDDVIEFIMKRTDEEMKKLVDFVENVPTVMLETEYECRQCATVNNVKVTSLADFF